MVARDIREADDMVAMGICPICNEELITSRHVERHNDNPYYNESLLETRCPNHGDINELLTEYDFGE